MHRLTPLLAATILLCKFSIVHCAEKPQTIYWEGSHLAQVKQQLPASEDALQEAFTNLRRNAEAALRRGPYSVMQKTEIPPSGDKHDYLSYSRYWWPNPDTADGLPYVRRDGQTNVEMRSRGDRDRIGQLYLDVEALTLAHYFFEEEKYAQHARQLIQTWFLDRATSMNPNLQFGQAVPGRSVGRGVGIIDTRGFIVVLDCVALLCEAGVLTDDEDEQLRAWFTKYLSWLLKSDLGKDEQSKENNHGSWYAAQTARIALYLGKIELAREIVLETKNRRIPAQFQTDGYQPHELQRTKSLHYSLFNLSALSVVARVGEQLGIDLWRSQSDPVEGLERGLSCLLPYLMNQDRWPHQQIQRYELSPRILLLLRMASVRYQEPKYVEAIQEVGHRHAELDYSPLVVASLSRLSPQVKVIENSQLELTAYQLPDLSSYTAAHIRQRVPDVCDGKVRVAETSEYELLEEAFRRERGVDLQRRQGTKNTRVIVVQDGTVTLKQLVDLLHDEAIASQSESAVTVRLPILIEPSGTLLVDGSETAEVRLSTARGAFIANAGRLFVIGAKITSWDEAASKPTVFSDKSEFRPYISSYVRSQTFLAGSRFEHLGYLAPTAYGLSLSSHPERERGAPSDDWPTGQIVDCVFTGLYYGFYSYEARDVAIVGNSYEDSIRYGIDPHDRSTRLIIANNIAKKTRERHGIIGSRGVSQSYIFGNKSHDNTGSGIMLDRQCSENVVVENQVFNNGQGISVYESKDNLIAKNFIAANSKSGVRIRNSTGVRIENNTIVGNRDYAFEVYSKRLEDHEKRFARGDYYQNKVKATIRSNTATGNKGCVKGSQIQWLSLSDVQTELDQQQLKNLLPTILPAFSSNADRNFGSQLKPFREQLRQAFEGPARTVEFRYD